MESVKGPDYPYITHTTAAPTQLYQAAQKCSPFLRLHQADKGKYSMVASPEAAPWTEIKKSPGSTEQVKIPVSESAVVVKSNPVSQVFCRSTHFEEFSQLLLRPILLFRDPSPR